MIYSSALKACNRIAPANLHRRAIAEYCPFLPRKALSPSRPPLPLTHDVPSKTQTPHPKSSFAPFTA